MLGTSPYTVLRVRPRKKDMSGYGEIELLLYIRKVSALIPDPHSGHRVVHSGLGLNQIHISVR